MINTTKVPVNYYQEGEVVIADSPALGLITQGDNFDDARKMFEEVLEIFYEENDTTDKLEKTLLGLGWQKINKIISPPQEVARIYTEIKLPEFSQ